MEEAPGAARQDMVPAEILAVGDELASGIVQDGNSFAIARVLLEAGVEAHRHTVVRDDLEELQAAVEDAAGRAAVVVVSGGLGPTEDDCTREAAARAAGVDLVEDRAWLETIQGRLAVRGLPWSASQARQALLPRGARALSNRLGTAVGFEMAVGGCRLFAVPGVQREMEAMVREEVVPRLRALFPAGPAAAWRELHLTGATEAQVGERLADLMRPGPGPRVGITVHEGIMTVRILAVAAHLGQAEEKAEETAALVRDRAGELVFAEGGRTLHEAVGALLLARGVSFTLAESCTGGLLGALLTEVPGISQVFREGFVVYANQAKVQRLGVPRGLLDTHGAVSPEAALAMASGARRTAGARLGAAVTGIAGPEGGSPGKPVGLVFCAVDLDGVTAVERRMYGSAGRDVVRSRAARDCLFLMRRLLLQGS